MPRMHVGVRYFAAVARCGSIREAAEELHVAQSALSRQVQKLEDELGAPLFQRHSRGVELTSAGEILLGHAQTSLRQVERVRSEVDGLKGLRRGVVHVSAIESLVPHLLPQVIARFNRRHPGIQFAISIEGSDRVLAAVAGSPLSLARRPRSHDAPFSRAQGLEDIHAPKQSAFFGRKRGREERGASA